MIKRLILISFVTVLMAGCQSLKPQAEKAVDVMAKATYVDEMIKSGAVLDSLFDSDLSQEEIEIINKSLLAYNDFTGKWGKIIVKNPLEAVSHTSLIISEYNVLRIRYAEIERIATTHWTRYPEDSQFLLLEYQRQAKSLDDLVMSLLSQSKTNTALLAIQRMAVVAGQIALKLI
ncbi:hypothetical protein [Nitrosomonas sp. Nm132]|uniref:hypothetical protein n=1 Tax=Nitrosomonas sp. Nm132 TaxID=1881053 RepID=UPI00088A28F7|nr:hypothetical protein [Nitrosomonas sp. Nm132]SDH27927.1 hypothetical protein SAMN05428952_1009103 [Nitrosomonas sp. Nm132]